MVRIIPWLLIPFSAYAFSPHPTLSGMPDQSWKKVQDYYTCNYDLCYQTLDYSGMTYDQHRHKILMFGGGHATQLWNQVEEFDFATLGWKQLYQPDDCPFYQDPSNGYPGVNGQPAGGTRRADGSVYPISRHTYDGLDMLTDTCLMIMSTVQEGKGNCVNQSQWDSYSHFHDGYVWVFDPVGVRWTRLSNDAYNYGSGNAVDPQTDLLYGKNGTGNQMYSYNWKTKTRVTVSNNCPVGWEIVNPLVYYPTNHSFFLFASNNIYEFNINSKTWTTKNPSGKHVNAYNKNIPYDSRNDVFGIVKDGEFSYYSPSANAWYNQPYDTGLYPANPNYNHTIYDPVDNVYVSLVSSGYRGWTTWAYKLSDTPGKLPGTRQGVGTSRLREAPADPADVTLSPNPVRARARIHVSGADHGPLLHAGIYDAHGRRLAALSSHDASWDASRFPAGIYWLRVAWASKAISRRFTIIR